MQEESLGTGGKRVTEWEVGAGATLTGFFKEETGLPARGGGAWEGGYAREKRKGRGMENVRVIRSPFCSTKDTNPQGSGPR